MTIKTIEGVHIHPQDGTKVYYRYQYQLRPIGIYYQVDVGLGEAKSRLMSGVFALSLRSLLFPRKLIEKTTFQSINMFDIDDFRSKF